MAIDNNAVVVGSPNGEGAFAYDLTSQTPQLPVVTFVDPTAIAGLFGYSVAIDDDHVVVGAPLDDGQLGAAYVYQLSSATPSTALHTLTRGVQNVDDLYGFAVAISENQVLVSAASEDNGAINSGQVYVYDLDAATPAMPTSSLAAPTPTDGQSFGDAVSVSAGVTLIGASFDSTVNFEQGAAYAYVENTLPTITDQEFSVAEDNDGSQPFGTIMAFDAESTLTISIDGGSGLGVFSVDAQTGELSVNSQLDFESTDSYELVVSATDASGASSTAVVTVVVTNVNEAPSAFDLNFGAPPLGDPASEDAVVSLQLGVDVALSEFASDIDSVLTTESFSFDAADVTIDGSTSTFTTLSEVGVSYDSVTGQFGLDPTEIELFQALGEGEFADVVITFTASDGELSDTGTVTFSVFGVNDAPLALDPDIGQPPLGAPSSEDAVITIQLGVDVPLFEFATDVDNVLTTESFTFDSATINGSTNTLTTLSDLGISYDSVTGQFVLDPTGIEPFQALSDGETANIVIGFTASDGELSDTGTMTLSMFGVNDAPIANDDSATTPIDTPVTIDLTDNDTDVDGTIDDTSLVIVQPVNGNVVDNGDGTVSYTPDLNFFGTDTFTYTVLDDDGEISNEATVTVTVTELNDAPIANDDTATTPEETPVTIDLTVNDTDVDGTIDDTSLVIVQPNNGLVVDNGDGTVSYTPDLNFFGTDTFTYTVLDDDGEISNEATVTVTVTELNDAPIANDDSATTPIDTPVTIDLTDNDTDVDGTIDDTSLVIVQPVNGNVVDNGDGTVSYTPDLNFFGIDTFTYTVLDDDGEISNEATVTVTVTELNDAPIANDDSATTPIDTPVTIDLTDNDTDVDGTIDDTSLVIVQPDNGTVVDNGDGTVSYTPDLNFVGTDTFTYTVLDDDGEISNEATVTVTVTELNDAPIANDDTATTPMRTLRSRST